MMRNNAGQSYSGFRLVQYLRNRPHWLILFIAITALLFRFWQLDSVPPGWRDDELINSLVISQKALDGDWAIYYADASGHEALYHILSAGTLALFGPGVAGIRWLPAVLGTITVILTYLVASELYGRKVAFLASLTLSMSFWSLMYSRIGIRHISLPLFMLASFYFLWRGLRAIDRESGEERAIAVNLSKGRNPFVGFALSGLFLGISFYTYFASRGIPVILILFVVYLLLFQRDTLKQSWRGFLLLFFLAALLAVPLVITLLQQPETEARVEELAVPLVAAREGDFAPLGQHIARTLSMFHSDGDDEWLYNIPHRPVFGPVGAVYFWTGILTALWYAIKPLARLAFRTIRRSGPASLLQPNRYRESAGAFVLIWWLAGISPGFFSVPAASLGHTIIAQPAVYILVSLPLLPFGEWLHRRFPSRVKRNQALLATLGLVLLASIAVRDIPDYFVEWPSRGLTRFLYRAEIKEVGAYLNEHPELTDYGVTGLLAGPWDRLALEIHLDDPGRSKARWYDPSRVLLTKLNGRPAVVFSGYPSDPDFHPEYYQLTGETAGEYGLSMIAAPENDTRDAVCFANGLCLVSAQYEPAGQTLELIWDVAETLDLPAQPLISNPPPPGVYSGPRLLVFAQLVDTENAFLVGDDGLWVDAAGVEAGDQFIQKHHLVPPDSVPAAAVLFGLYDPMTGERILTTQGDDHLRLDLEHRRAGE